MNDAWQPSLDALDRHVIASKQADRLVFVGPSLH